ncbi:PAS domain S-box protein [Desulfolutivibrio sulfoxidireducens]|nr:PAS domain S-box protein [Desulfolutivibrio sulfoxidireducens]
MDLSLQFRDLAGACKDFFLGEHGNGSGQGSALVHNLILIAGSYPEQSGSGGFCTYRTDGRETLGRAAIFREGTKSRGFTRVRKKGSQEIGRSLPRLHTSRKDPDVPKRKDNALLVQELRALRGRLIDADIQRITHDREESARLTAQSRYQAIVENQAELICGYDPLGILTYVNPAFCRYHGREARGLLGTPFPAFASEQDLLDVRRAVSDLGPDRGMTALVHRVILPDGGVRWQEWAHRAVMDASGAVVEYQAVGRDVTDIREAMEAHRRAEEKYRAIFENAPLGIFRTTAAGRFEELNQVMAAMLGFQSPEEAASVVMDIGREFYDDPARRLELLAALEKASGNITFETVFRRRDGGRFTGRLHVSAVRDETGRVVSLIGLMDDITERMRMEEELRRSERTARTLLNSTLELAFLVDVDGTILAVNDIGAKRLGGSPGEVVGRNFWEYMPWETFERSIDRAWEAFCERRPVRFEDERTGFIHDVLISPVFNDAGGVDKVAVFAQDITERRRLERLREDVERITRHDMKTPLIGIVGFAQLLLKSANLTDKQREYLAYIQNSGRQMMDYIKKSLDYFRMEQRSYVLRPQPVDMARVFRRIHEDLRPLAVNKSVLVAFVMDGEEISLARPIFFRGEEDHLENLFANLIKNAVEAAPEDSVVTVSIFSGKDAHRVDIHNPGVIPEAARARFFERYNTAGKEGGTGLGVYVARLIAEVHGGAIDYRTDPGEGTCLRVTLPTNPPGE